MTDAEKLEALEAMLDEWVEDYATWGKEKQASSLGDYLGCRIYDVRQILDK